MRNRNRETKTIKHSLLFVSNEECVSEAATENHLGQFWKKMFLKSRQKTCKFTTLHVFCKDFAQILNHLLLFLKQSFKIFFPEHLSRTSVCVETVLSKLLRLLFKDALLRNHNRKQHKNRKFFIVCSTTFHDNQLLI